jgi:plastocyanin
MPRLTPLSVALPALALIAFGCGNPASPAVPTVNVSIIQGAVAQGPKGFAPNPLVTTVAAGKRVVWTNGDYTDNGYGSVSGGTAHHLISNEGLFDSGNVNPQRSFTFDFPGAGTYQYHCLVHPGMTGTITINP